MVAHHPDLALGCEDDGWGSREAQPQRHAGSHDTPLRLGAKTVPAKDPEGNAVACYGRSRPTANQMWWRCVKGRPGSAVTGAFLAWLAVDCAAQGKRALVRIGDHAAWHVSQAVQEWIKAHHRNAKHAGGCRFIVGR
jgi:hypothetical protein